MAHRKHLYRSGTSSTGDHILFLTSGTTPNLRHQASGGGTVTITSSVAIVNDYHLVDDRRDLATGTPRVVRGRLVARLEYRGSDQHQRPLRALTDWPDIALFRRHLSVLDAFRGQRAGELEPVDVANAAVFLLSSEARYITGVSIDRGAGAQRRRCLPGLGPALQRWGSG